MGCVNLKISKSTYRTRAFRKIYFSLIHKQLRQIHGICRAVVLKCKFGKLVFFLKDHTTGQSGQPTRASFKSLNNSQ